MTNNTNSLLKKTVIALLACMAIQLPIMAQNAAPVATAAPAADGYSVLRWVLTAIAVLFLFIIGVLAYGIKVATDMKIDKLKSAKQIGKVTVLLIMASLLLQPALAQNVAPAVAATAPEVKSSLFNFPSDIWVYLAGVFVLFLVIVAEVFALYNIMDMRKVEKAVDVTGKPQRSLFDRLHDTVPVELEDTLDMEHDYDGIRELDNKIPGWWNWAFYATILFAIVYLYRMFVTDTLPTQEQELAKANEIAAVQQAAILKSQANQVDEKTVKMADAAGIAAGKIMYDKNCVACHGDKGQGGIGPNLTDDYWIHKGSLSDIFYSIKYGWPEKGMQAWQGNFSPNEIAQLASYVKSLHGTNPPGAKEKQGELYTEEAAAPAAAADTAQAK